MTNMIKGMHPRPTQEAPRRDYLKGAAYAVWALASAAAVYAVAVLLVMFVYASSGHGAEASGGEHWYWSAVFIGAAWTFVGAAAVAFIGLSLAWATNYLEEH